MTTTALKLGNNWFTPTEYFDKHFMIKISDKKIEVSTNFYGHISYVYFAHLLIMKNAEASKRRIFLSLIFVLKQ